MASITNYVIASSVCVN